MKRIILPILLLVFLFTNAQENNKFSTALKYVLNHPLTAENESIYPELFKTAFVEALNKETNQYEEGLMCIVRTKNHQALLEKGIQIQSILPKFVVAFLPINKLQTLANLQEVSYIDLPKIIYPTNEIGAAQAGAPLLHTGKLNNTNYLGDGILAGIFDTGIDWDHPDFRDVNDQTKSKIVRLWDQTITPIAGESSPNGFNYGVEYTQAHINNEIDGTPTGYVRERDLNGHGTHVAGTVAGNGAALSSKKNKGIAPNADLVIVKGGNNSFSTANIVNAITYFTNVANAMGKPIVVNMSIGGQGGAHDGTNDDEIAVDNFCNSAPGRVMCISAGNDNGAAIHRQVALNAGASGTYTINVPMASGNSSTGIFQISIYVNSTNTVNATLTMPDGLSVTANANQSISPLVNNTTATAYFDNYIDPESGDRLINLYVVRNNFTANQSGAWTLTLTNTSTQAVRLDGWLNYRGPNFSTTNLLNGDNNYLVASPGNATNAITVASYVGKLDWFATGIIPNNGYSYSGATQQDNISTFSSRGPRRDDVLKPNIAANGQAVVSCLSSDASHISTDITTVGLYKKSQGTSMSSPVGAGCVALLLQVKPNATFLEIRNAIQNTANSDVFTTSSLPNFTFGFGKLDVFKAASSLKTCTTFERETYSYDSSTTSANNTQTDITNRKVAVRFTSSLTGKIGGVYIKTGTKLPVGNITIEIREADGNNPSNLLGTSIITPSEIAKFTWNYFDVSSLNVSVNNNDNFFVVVYANSADTLFIGNESLTVSGRSRVFNSNWSASNTDYRIRTVMYNNAIPSTSSTQKITACGSYTWNNTTYTQSGIYTINNLVNSVGCDSSATLELTIKPIYTINASSGNNGNISPNGAVNVCEGESQAFTITPNNGFNIENVFVNGVALGAISSYSFNNITSHQTIQATFSVNCSTTFSNQSITICSSELPYSWNGLNFNNAGSQTTKLLNAKGCDSFATLTLNIVNTLTPTIQINGLINVCANQSASFNAIISNGGANPIYNWYKNGNSIGTNEATLILQPNTFSTNDVIECILLSNNACQNTNQVKSNSIRLNVLNAPTIGSFTSSSSIVNNTINYCSYGNQPSISITPNGGTWSSSNPSTISFISNSSSIIPNSLSNSNSTLTYTLSNINGCSSSKSLNISVAVLATPSSIIGATNICVGSTETYSSLPSGGIWSTQGRTTINSNGLATGTNAGPTSIVYRITNIQGCSATTSLPITVNALPAIPSIAYAAGTISPQVAGGFCTNRTFTLNGIPAGGTWSKTGVINISTNGIVNTGNLPGSASISYTITNLNGCKNARTLSSNVVACASRGVINNYQKEENIVIYPNPTKQNIFVKNLALQPNSSLIMFDVLGKQIINQPLHSINQSVDIRGVSKGVYFLKIFSGTESSIHKIVVE
jgi:hypothetical protein